MTPGSGEREVQAVMAALRAVTRSRFRALVLPGMVAALGSYVVLHSPLRATVAGMAGRSADVSYFAGGAPAAGAARDAAAAVLLLAAAVCAAAAAAARARVRSDERPVVFGVCAFAFIVIPAAYIGGLAAWLGTTLLRPPLGPLMAAIPAVAVIGFALGRGWRPSPGPTWRGVDGRLLPFAALAGGLLAASAALALAQPPTGFDALSFHAPMGVYFWRDGNLASLLDRAPSGFALAQGGAGELWFGLLRVAGGERLANLGQLPFALLGSAAVYAFARHLGAARPNSRLAAAAFLLTPLVVVQAGIQVTDVVAAALLMSAAVLASERADRWTTDRCALVGVALALAVTVKLAALPAAAAIGVFVAARAAAGLWGHGWSMTLAALVLVVACGVTGGPWWVRNAVRFGNPIYPAAIPLLGRGVVIGEMAQKDLRYVPSRTAWPLYPLLESHSDQSGLGALFLVGALPGVVVAAGRRRRRAPFVLYALVAAFAVPAWWMLTQHEPRHLLAVFGLSFAFLPWSVRAVPRCGRRAAAVTLLMAAVFSALVTVDQTLAPRLGYPTERARFYDEVWGVDMAVAGMPEDQPMLYHTGHANLSYAGDYPLLGPSLGRRLVTVDGTRSTAHIVQLMREHRLQLAYVPASRAAQPEIEAAYSSEYFTAVGVSTIAAGESSGTRRYLYRLRAGEAEITAPSPGGAK